MHLFTEPECTGMIRSSGSFRRAVLIALGIAACWQWPPVVAQIAIIRNPVTGAGNEFRVTEIEVNADIRDQVSSVQIAQNFENTSRRTLETQFVFPLPDDASITDLTLVVDGKELPGELKPKDQARSEYEAIVRKQQDPALLEYIGRGLFRTSVFPIPAGQSRRVEIRYTQLLKNDSGLTDFTLPLGTTKHSTKSVDELSVTVRIKSGEELKNIYSPTHDLEIDRQSDKKATCRLKLENVAAPNDFRLLYSVRGGDVGMSLVTHKPSNDEQGYFLLLATPKIKVKKNEILPKTVIFVVDRSGSMAGKKIEQAKASISYMVNSLNDSDTFNIVSYSSEVDVFRPEIETVNSSTREAALNYIEDIYSGGGTNIDNALTTALEQLTDSSRPSYVMFFTDGLPTVGETREATIAANVRRQNRASARLFNFGVGYDVNSRLLDRLSRDQRGTSVYVKPEEDIEVAAGNLFQKVSMPAMTDVEVGFEMEQPENIRKPVNRVYPSSLPDLFRGEQLVVVGRYRQHGPVEVRLEGKVNKDVRNMKLNAKFGDKKSTRRNGFVATLWATRRIGDIIDELDLNGQNKELVSELVDLSLKYGIMTPYTSFLADENTPLNDRRRLTMESESLTSDGLSIVSGASGFRQREFKQRLQKADRGLNLLNKETALSSRFGVTRPSANAPADSVASGGFGGGRQSGGVARDSTAKKETKPSPKCCQSCLSNGSGTRRSTGGIMNGRMLLLPQKRNLSTTKMSSRCYSSHASTSS